MGLLATLTLWSSISSILSFYFTYGVPYLCYLYVIQAFVQAIQAGIKHYYLKYKLPPKNTTTEKNTEKSTEKNSEENDPSQERTSAGIPFIRSIGNVLGLTGMC
jgi:hypothetical protein